MSIVVNLTKSSKAKQLNSIGQNMFPHPSVDYLSHPIRRVDPHMVHFYPLGHPYCTPIKGNRNFNPIYFYGPMNCSGLGKEGTGSNPRILWKINPEFIPIDPPKQSPTIKVLRASSPYLVRLANVSCSIPNHPRVGNRSRV